MAEAYARPPRDSILIVAMAVNPSHPCKSPSAGLSLRTTIRHLPGLLDGIYRIYGIRCQDDGGTQGGPRCIERTRQHLLSSCGPLTLSSYRDTSLEVTLVSLSELPRPLCRIGYPAYEGARQRWETAEGADKRKGLPLSFCIRDPGTSACPSRRGQRLRQRRREEQLTLNLCLRLYPTRHPQREEIRVYENGDENGRRGERARRPLRRERSP